MDADLKVSIYDISGQVVREVYKGEGDANRLFKWSIDLHGLNAGSYHVMVVANSEVYNSTVILTGR
ncbi:MAG: T9SS type A sorting domain-containing protein [Flavobacteriales bacterium]|nr:T9SS type A sorting domain-containing protein [Flavobacteriales bacterium]